MMLVMVHLATSLRSIFFLGYFQDLNGDFQFFSSLIDYNELVIRRLNSFNVNDRILA